MSTTEQTGDRTRPASALSDRELDAALAEWITGLVWRVERCETETRVRLTIYAPGEERPTFEGWWKHPNDDGTVSREYGGVTRHPLPRYSTTHDGAAQLREHVRSLGAPNTARFVHALRLILNDALRDDESAFGPTDFALVDATPRQQAEACWEAFIRHA